MTPNYSNQFLSVAYHCCCCCPSKKLCPLLPPEMPDLHLEVGKMLSCSFSCRAKGMRNCRSTSVVLQGAVFPRPGELTSPVEEFPSKSLAFHSTAQTAPDKLLSDRGRHWKMQLCNQEDSVRTTGTGVLKRNKVKATPSSKEAVTQLQSLGMSSES